MHNFCINSCWQCQKNHQDVLIEPRVCETNDKAPPPLHLKILSLPFLSHFVCSVCAKPVVTICECSPSTSWLALRHVSLHKGIYSASCEGVGEKRSPVSSFLFHNPCIYFWRVTLGYDFKHINAEFPNASGSVIHHCRQNPLEFPVE